MTIAPALRCALFLLLPVLLAVSAVAQPDRLVVMNLAAHPDDEDGSTLAYYRHVNDARAYSVIYTRGEGGQNEIGPELYEALGAIRTQETEMAARILGTQVFFLNFYDFGYSKFADEAFDRWGGRDEVTSEIVYLIRKLKPHVLFTNHDTLTVGPRKQHGQHQAVGISAYDAFSLAADAEYHPEQLDEDGVDLWQPQRLFLRHRFRQPQAYDVRVPVGTTAPLSDQTAGEIAIEALSQHASQGMHFFVQQGRAQARTHNYYTLLRSATAAPLDTLDLAGNIQASPTPKPSLTYLLDAGRLRRLPKRTVMPDHPIAVPGQTVTLKLDPRAAGVLRTLWHFEAPDGSTVNIDPDSPFTATLTLSETATPTLPKAEQQYTRFTNGYPIRYALLDPDSEQPIAGGYVPMEIAPPVVLDPPEGVTRLTEEARTVAVEGQVYAPDVAGLQLGAQVLDGEGQVLMERNTPSITWDEDGRFTVSFDLAVPPDTPPGDYTLRFLAQPYGQAGAQEEIVLEQQARVLEPKVAANLNVGVVESYDNTLSRALEELGVSFTKLDSTALASGSLADLHTIVVDIRAYLVRQDLRTYNARLLDWVADGGHLIVNYQKVFEWNARYNDPFDSERKNPGTFAPYPLELSRDRVTYEDAPVRLLQADHPLFRTPNAISEVDWDGWVQERGLYFPRTYDERYVPLLGMQDPGETSLEGSTLFAEYGKGTYLYTALSWYRQLKIFHPGAYRLFANQISLPLVDGRDLSTTH